MADYHIDPINIENVGIIRFKQIMLDNIINDGNESNDDKDTYNRLAEIANDSGILTNTFGTILGKIIYLIPTSWKASMYINEMTTNINHIGMLLIHSTNYGDHTIGVMSTHLVDKLKYHLSENIQSKFPEIENVDFYNIGLQIRSQYQNHKIASYLFDNLYLFKTILDKIDNNKKALFIATKPDNNRVIYLVNKFEFIYLSTTVVKRFSYLGDNIRANITYNTYYKLLD